MKKSHKGSRHGGDGGGGSKRGGGSKAGGKYATLVKSTSEEDISSNRDSSASGASPAYLSDRSSTNTGTNSSIASDASSSPFAMSPWNNVGSNSPWSSNAFYDPTTMSITAGEAVPTNLFPPGTGLVGSLVREEGHIYSLAAFGDLLYTGSDSKNIRVWKNQDDYSAFKSTSGLVKTIVISSDHRIFTGHQDGKIRVWVVSPKNPKDHRRVGTLPRLKDFLKSSMNPHNYVESRRKNQKSGVWIRHSDAVSTLSLSEDQSLLYSGSWDRTFKVWRLADSRCLESVNAHDDAVNAMVNAFDIYVFTGSADGTVKVWKRESAAAKGAGTRHVEVQTLLKQESAVTALAVNRMTGLVYCGSSDGVVNLWSKGLAHGGVLRGHKLAVLCLAAAGSLLFSGSADKTICIWGLEVGGTHVCLSVLTGHTGPVKCLTTAADHTDDDRVGPGKLWVLYSGSLDKSVKVWKVCDTAQVVQPNGSSSGPPKYDSF